MKIKTVKSMPLFIESIRESDKYTNLIYTRGSCYKFHKLLKKFCPECEPRISVERNHVVTLFKGKHFDITGEAKGYFYPLIGKDIEMVEKWSFDKSMFLELDCPFCENTVLIDESGKSNY
jgi:hypothetical protein